MEKRKRVSPSLILSSILAIISVLLVFLDVYTGFALSLFLLSAVMLFSLIRISHFLSRETYLVFSMILGLIIIAMHFFVHNLATPILFLLVVYSVGFILLVLPVNDSGKGKSIREIRSKAAQIKKDIIRRSDEKNIQESPSIQIIEDETDNIYKELERIEQDLKRMEYSAEELKVVGKPKKRKRTAKKKRGRKKKAVKSTKKKTASRKAKKKTAKKKS